MTEMTRSGIELAGIFRRYGPAYRQQHPVPLHQRKLMSAIELCRTAAMGGHRDQCDQCDFTRISYNSCRNRHCPKCQASQRDQWVQARRKDLLPVTYYHVVFTLPAGAAEIAFYNPVTVYGILFNACRQTLLTIGADPKHLGAELGFFAILHTWGQNLLFHPHLHCVVPGGGFAGGRTRWISCKPGFFLPVRVLSRLFRRLFVEQLQQAFQQGAIRFPINSALAGLNGKQQFQRRLGELGTTEWVVYAKPPFGGPERVLEYLGRYTHRVAISNHRLLEADEGQVRFRWRDYRRGNKKRVMTLSAEEFIRRFLLHTLPPGFQRIRHYGWLASAGKQARVQLCRELIAQAANPTGLLPTEPMTSRQPRDNADQPVTHGCPRCGNGVMIRQDKVPAIRCRRSPGDTS